MKVYVVMKEVCFGETYTELMSIYSDETDANKEATRLNDIAEANHNTTDSYYAVPWDVK